MGQIPIETKENHSKGGVNNTDNGNNNSSVYEIDSNDDNHANDNGYINDMNNDNEDKNEAKRIRKTYRR